MKRTFVVPEEKEADYEKFKSLVPEVSSKLMEFIEDYVRKQEAVSKQMEEQTIHEGVEYSEFKVFKGDTFKFYGALIAEGYHDTHNGLHISIFLTKKGKLLVYSIRQDEFKPEEYFNYAIYEDYFEMRDKAGLSNNLISQCEAYLNKNSVERTYKVLDV